MFGASERTFPFVFNDETLRNKNAPLRMLRDVARALFGMLRGAMRNSRATWIKSFIFNSETSRNMMRNIDVALGPAKAGSATSFGRGYVIPHPDVAPMPREWRLAVGSKSNRIEVVGVAPAGLSIAINGQEFTSVGTEPFTRRCGERTVLVVWQAECATCGTGIIAKALPGAWPAIRRCEKHRQPGRRVKARPVTTSENSSITVGAERASATEFDREARHGF
jgi:hypothetical protein